MIKHVAHVVHDPERGKWGDCFRASIAAILDIEDVVSVPHFFDRGVDGETGLRLCDGWLSRRHMRLVMLGCDGLSFDETLEAFRDCPVPQIIIGETADGGHCIIAYDGAVLHDVALVRVPMLTASVVLIIAAALDVGIK